MSKWISVKDRFPADLIKVIVYCKHGLKDSFGVDDIGVDFIRSSMDNGERCDSVFNNNGKKVTHWMPLPEPPK